ncbi:hypothetical protein CDAR_282331 [Caerostris darwini]|uniref:Uncharacterized protein n=1 Tax=Caerostris darwini TaxID=1538125 RepID=A0AAV4QI70_9ARAC|nr:hypothetical protein CDAR_282331 [Caerostris darwini]
MQPNVAHCFSNRTTAVIRAKIRRKRQKQIGFSLPLCRHLIKNKRIRKLRCVPIRISFYPIPEPRARMRRKIRLSAKKKRTLCSEKRRCREYRSFFDDAEFEVSFSSAICIL